MKIKTSMILLGASLLTRPATSQTTLFDFDSAPVHSPLPLSLSVNGITAQFSATGQGFSIQPANTLGFTPAGFSGNCVYPSSVFAADLLVSFSQSLSDLSVLYAPEEYACDSSATMRVAAYLDSALVGTATMTAEPPGTWPSATLAISVQGGFNNVMIHYDAPPPTGGDYGPIFMADNFVGNCNRPRTQRPGRDGPRPWARRLCFNSGVNSAGLRFHAPTVRKLRPSYEHSAVSYSRPESQQQIIGAKRLGLVR
jgi:hypothetical protein